MERPATIEQWMSLPWRTTFERWSEEDGTTYLVARNPELGECIGTGETAMEALADLKSARRSLLTVLLEDGIEIDLPAAVSEMKPAAVEQDDFKSYWFSRVIAHVDAQIVRGNKRPINTDEGSTDIEDGDESRTAGGGVLTALA